MKIAEGLEVIKEGWIKKPKGFRVRYHLRTETGYEFGYSPPLDATPMNSDVTTWRYAWKLWQATITKSESGEPGAMYNITVVDDEDRPYPFYATGELEIYNPKVIETTQESMATGKETP